MKFDNWYIIYFVHNPSEVKNIFPRSLPYLEKSNEQKLKAHPLQPPITGWHLRWPESLETDPNPTLNPRSNQQPMDSAETTEEEENKDHRNSWLRRSLSLVFSLVAFLSFSFVLGFVAVFVGSTAISNPISVPSQCKIVSSSKLFLTLSLSLKLQ